MMTRAEKETIVKSLQTNLEKSQAVFVTNLIGVSANETVDIRKNIREAGGQIVVTRNTLFCKAAEGTVYGNALKDLKGPHAVAFAFDDAVAIAKVINDVSKDNEMVQFKAGVLDGKDLSIEEIKKLANLPSRDQMLATVLATFNAPISAFVRVIDAIKKQKEEGGESAVAAEATE